MNFTALLTEISQISNDSSICLSTDLNKYYWLFHHHHFILIKLIGINDKSFSFVECSLAIENTNFVVKETKIKKKLPINAKSNLSNFHQKAINPFINNLSYIPHLRSYPEVIFNLIYRDQNLHKTDTFLCHKHLLSFQK